MDYQNEYIALHPDLHCGEAELKSKKILEVLSPNLRIDSILDVACGSGKILLNLSERLRSNRSVGVDISNKVMAGYLVRAGELLGITISDVFPNILRNSRF